MTTQAQYPFPEKSMNKEIARDWIVENRALNLQLKPGNVVKLWWERNNQHNPRALKLTYFGFKVGYVQKNSETEDILCNTHNEGKFITAYITAVNNTDPTQHKYQVGFKIRNTEAKAEEDDVAY